MQSLESCIEQSTSPAQTGHSQPPPPAPPHNTTTMLAEDFEDWQQDIQSNYPLSSAPEDSVCFGPLIPPEFDWEECAWTGDLSAHSVEGATTLSPYGHLQGMESMRLRDTSISPMVPSLSLEAVHEEDEEIPMFARTNSDLSTEAMFQMDLDTSSEVNDRMDEFTPEGFCSPEFKNMMDASPHGMGFTSHPTPGNEFSFTRRSTEGEGIAASNTSWQDDFPSTFSGSSEMFPGSHSTVFSPGSETSTAGSFSKTAQPLLADLPRRTSSKRRRSMRTSSGKNLLCSCIFPDRPKMGQRMHLNELPIEILLDIFEYAFLSPVKAPRCEHRTPAPNYAAPGLLGRRATESSFFLSPPNRTSAPLTDDGETETPPTPTGSNAGGPDEPLRLSDSLRVYRAKTLLNITLTCKLFNQILSEDPGTDLKLWRSAARWCWDWLPENLGEVQGTNKTSQTSWRNLVAVFMRSENGLFGKKGGGKGGVESFGGKRSGVPAVPWKTEQAQRSAAEANGRQPRKLVLACAQPGPDLFKVTLNKDSRSWTISVSLRGGVEYFAHLDEYGRFGKKPGRLPGGLKRSKRNVGYFPPDIFEVEGDRTQLVKVILRKGRRPTATVDATMMGPAPPRKPLVQEVVVWNLVTIPVFASDPKSRVARCVSRDGLLVCNLFTHGSRLTGLEFMIDPPEDHRLYCLEARDCRANGVGERSWLSENQRGKLPATQDETRLRWQREFVHPHATDFPASQQLHPVICNMAIDDNHFVALVRWNIRTPESAEEIVDRAFHILAPQTGETLHVLEFPNLYWDFRHHDMSPIYNALRHKKLSRLYNALTPHESMGAGNRATRIHDDAFILTSDTIISGSHDYCNWIWPIPSTTTNPTTPSGPKPVYNEVRNDAGINDPFTVLDDFYWSAGRQQKWTSNNERAGWWVRTPNQVLCFWHGISLSPDARWFAACRPGKMFVWDRASGNNAVRGYTSLEPDAEKHKGWMGRLASHAKGLGYRLKSWFLWEDVVPEQGLWLLFDDAKAVFLDRDEILEACGLGKKKWAFAERDFMFEEAEEVVGADERDEEESAGESEWGEEEWEDDNDDEEWDGGGKRRKVEEVTIEGFWEPEGSFVFAAEEEGYQ